MPNDISPEKSKKLSTPAEIKAYLHPLRLVLLKKMAYKKQTISQIARELKVHPANITHHIKLLENQGLIRLVERRDIGKNIEKYYRASAFHFSVQMDSDKPEDKKQLALCLARDDLSYTLETLDFKDDRPLLTLIKSAKLKHSDLNKFFKKLMALVRDFEKSNLEEGEAYTLNMSLYPSQTEEILKENIILKQEKEK